MSIFDKLMFNWIKADQDYQITYKRDKNDKNPIIISFKNGKLSDMKNYSCVDKVALPFLKILTSLDGNKQNLTIKDLALLKKYFSDPKFSPAFKILGIKNIRFDANAGVENIYFDNASISIRATKKLKDFKPSENCENLIKKAESLRLEAYKCPAGVPTIGWGHTKGVKMGQKITKQQAEKLLKEDLNKMASVVKKHVKVEINQNQFDALVSFVFNVGEDAFKNSTMLNLINQKDFKGASKEFQRWVHADGKKLEGLVVRRENEKKMFLA